MSRLRVLVIAPLRLETPPNGGTLRTWAVCAKLATGADVTVVAPSGSVLPSELRATLRLSPAPERSLFRRALDSIAPGPTLARHVRRTLVTQVDHAVSSREADVVVLEHSVAAAAFGDFMARRSIPSIVDLHNLERARFMQVARSRPLILRPVYALDARRTARAEADALRQADVVVTVSAEEKRAALEAGAHMVLLCPNGVDDSYFSVGSAKGKRGWIFTGDLSYGPNVEGLEWFRSNVVPLLPDDVGPLRLVGRSPTDEIRRWAARDRRVELVAGPPSTLPWLAESAFAFNPVFAGAGTSLKVLQYAASGRPFVSTTTGTRGFPVADLGLNADNAEAFADRMTHLELEQDRAREIADELRERAAAFRWDGTLAPFEQAVLEGRMDTPE